jgi:hypothetical protein
MRDTAKNVDFMMEKKVGGELKRLKYEIGVVENEIKKTVYAFVTFLQLRQIASERQAKSSGKRAKKLREEKQRKEGG